LIAESGEEKPVEHLVQPVRDMDQVRHQRIRKRGSGA
jgi:hypothetical protein